MACATAGLRFVGIPIPDRGVPDDATLLPVLDQLHTALVEGGHVVIHCRAGIGRSSLLAGALLVRQGLEARDASERLATARGLAVPDTDQQRQWLHQFATR
jgi:protein-tyrosine phosphatase